MYENRMPDSRDRIAAEPVVVGLFAYASDARRALHVLHEHHFTSEQLAAAFRGPASPPADSPEPPHAPARASGQWFSQLRQIYRGNEEPRAMAHADAIPPAALHPAVETVGIESLLARIELSAQDATTLNGALNGGAAIVTVRAGERNHEAQTLLEQRGARILHSQVLEPREPIAPAAAVTVNSTPFQPPPPANSDHIQLYGEVMRVHKEKVHSGDVRVRKESVTRMETVQVPVTREHLVIEHTDGNDAAHPENTLRIPLSEERVHINKETVLREEYKVGKRDVTQNEVVSDTVRRERLLIDRVEKDPQR